MRIMFLSHMPENPGAAERNTKIRAQLQTYASPGTEIELCFPDDYPGAKVSEDLAARNEIPGLYHVLQTPAILRKIVWAEENGFDAVVQSNTFDPGVEASRQAVRIPVIGVLRTSLHIGGMLTDRMALVVPLESHVVYTWQIVRSYGMEGFVKDVRPVGMYDEKASDRKEEIFTRTVEVMRSVVEQTRAGCIIPLGGAVFPTLVSPADLEKEVGVPVFNTKALGIRFAEMCVELGLSHASATHPSAKLLYKDLSAFV